MRQHTYLLAALVYLLVACGAATGLDVPCSEPLLPATPALMVLADHSQALAGTIGYVTGPVSGPISAWTRVPRLFADVLPTLDAASVPVGLAVFPSLRTLPDEMPIAAVCTTPVLDFAPAAGQGAALVAYLRQDLDANDLSREGGFSPSGDQPLYAALEVARAALASAAPDAPRFILLVTTAAPDCDFDVTPATCICGQSACGDPASLPIHCLDLTRVASELTALRAAGIPTLVVNDDPPGTPDDVIARSDAWAALGGLARTGGARPSYDVEEHAAIASALATQVVPAGRCRLHTARPVDAHAGWDVVDATTGARLARDPEHAAGWDWTDAAAGRLEVYGPACEAGQAGATFVLSAAHSACPR